MYTKCPSCRSEISFQPPANIDQLPEDYKHRIKCPYCGVTIGVKLNKVMTTAPQDEPLTLAPTGGVQPYFGNAQAAENAAQKSKKDKKAKKGEMKSGAPRNVFMLLLGLLFVIISIIPAILNSLDLDNEIVATISAMFSPFDGIGRWAMLVNETEVVSAIFAAHEIVPIIMWLVPFVIFTMACLQVLFAIIALIIKKYPRPLSFVWSAVFATCTLLALFMGMLTVNAWPEMSEATTTLLADSGTANLLLILLIDNVEAPVSIGTYFMTLIQSFQFVTIAVAGLGVIQFLFSIFFWIAPMRKRKKSK